MRGHDIIHFCAGVVIACSDASEAAEKSARLDPSFEGTGGKRGVTVHRRCNLKPQFVFGSIRNHCLYFRPGSKQ
jgi:hypothetical protein